MPGEKDSSIDAAQAELAAQAPKEREVKGQELLYQHTVDAFQDISASLNLGTPEAAKVLNKGKSEVTTLLRRMAARGRWLIENPATASQTKTPEANVKPEKKSAPTENSNINDLAGSLSSTLNTYSTKLATISLIITKKQEAFNLLNAAKQVESSADVVNVKPFVPPVFVAAIDNALYGVNGDGGCMAVYKMLQNNQDLPKEFVQETMLNIDGKQTARLLELKIRGQQQEYIATQPFKDAVLSRFVIMDKPKKPGDKPTFTFTPAADILSKEEKEMITNMIYGVRESVYEEAEAATCPKITERFWAGKALFAGGRLQEAKTTLNEFIKEDLGMIAISSDPKLKGKQKAFKNQANAMIAQIDKIDGGNKDFFSAQELAQSGDIIGAKKLLKKYLAEHKVKKEGEADFTGSAKELLKRIALTQLADAREKFNINTRPPETVTKSVPNPDPDTNKRVPSIIIDIPNPEYLKFFRYQNALADMEREIEKGTYLDFTDAYNAVSARMGGFDANDGMNTIADQLVLDKGREGLLELARKYRKKGKYFGDPKYLQVAEQYFQEYFKDKLGETAKKYVSIDDLRKKYDANNSFHADIEKKVSEAKKKYDEYSKTNPEWAEKNPWDEKKAGMAIENQAFSEMQREETIIMMNNHYKLNKKNAGDSADQAAWNEFADSKGINPGSLSDEHVGRLVKDLPIDIAMIAVAGAFATATGGAASGLVFQATLSAAERQLFKAGAKFVGKELFMASGRFAANRALAAGAGFAVNTLVFTASHSVMKGVQTGQYSIMHGHQFMEEWLENMKIMGVLGMAGHAVAALQLGRVIGGMTSFGVEMAAMGTMSGQLTVDDFAMILGLKLGHLVPAEAKRAVEKIIENRSQSKASKEANRASKDIIYKTRFAPDINSIPPEMRGKPAYTDTTGDIVFAPDAFAGQGVTTTSRNGVNIFIVESAGGPYRGTKVEMPAKEFLRILAKEKAGKPLTPHEQALLPTVRAVRERMVVLEIHEKNHRLTKAIDKATNGRLSRSLEKLFADDPELQKEFEKRSAETRRKVSDKESLHESLEEFLSEIADGTVKTLTAEQRAKIADPDVRSVTPEQRARIEKTIGKEGKIKDFSFNKVRKIDTKLLADPKMLREFFFRERAAAKSVAAAVPVENAVPGTRVSQKGEPLEADKTVREPLLDTQVRVSKNIDGVVAPGLFLDVAGKEISGEQFDLSPEQMQSYLDGVQRQVDAGAHQDNTYHNAEHFKEFGERADDIVTEAKTPEDKFVLKTVAKWHDFNHPGKRPAQGLSVSDITKLYENKFTPEQVRDAVNRMLIRDNELLVEQNKGKDPKMQKHTRPPVADLDGKIPLTPEEVSAFLADASLVTSGLNVSTRLRIAVGRGIKITDFANSRNYPKTPMEWQIKLADMANFMKPMAEWLATTVKVNKEAPWGLPSSVEKYLNGEIFFLEKLVKEAVIDNPATKGLFGEKVTKPLEEKLNYLRERKAELEKLKTDKNTPQSPEFTKFVDAIKELFPNGVKVKEAETVNSARKTASQHDSQMPATEAAVPHDSQMPATEAVNLKSPVARSVELPKRGQSSEADIKTAELVKVPPELMAKIMTSGEKFTPAEQILIEKAVAADLVTTKTIKELIKNKRLEPSEKIIYELIQKNAAEALIFCSENSIKVMPANQASAVEAILINQAKVNKIAEDAYPPTSPDKKQISELMKLIDKGLINPAEPHVVEALLSFGDGIAIVKDFLKEGKIKLTERIFTVFLHEINLGIKFIEDNYLSHTPTKGLLDPSLSPDLINARIAERKAVIIDSGVLRGEIAKDPAKFKVSLGEALVRVDANKPNAANKLDKVLQNLRSRDAEGYEILKNNYREIDGNIMVAIVQGSKIEFHDTNGKRILAFQGNLLGGGSFGTVADVWFAVDGKTDLQLGAIKAPHEGGRDAFIREGQSAVKPQQWNDPNINKALHVSSRYIIYETGKNAKNLFSVFNKLTPAEAVEVLKQVMKGLIRYDDEGHMHCDLKEWNVIVYFEDTPSGRKVRVQLIDNNPVRKTDFVKGNTQHMLVSLEYFPGKTQVEVQEGRADAASIDQYSLGIIIEKQYLNRSDFSLEMNIYFNNLAKYLRHPQGKNEPNRLKGLVAGLEVSHPSY